MAWQMHPNPTQKLNPAGWFGKLPEPIQIVHAAWHCRCIKPNPESQPGNLTPNYVLEQLRAGGVLEAVRIACAGFPTRKAFRPFAMRYNILLASGRGAYRHLDPETLQDDEAADISRKVLQAVKIMGWQLGKTRVFLRAGQLAQLEVCTSAPLEELPAQPHVPSQPSC